VNNNDGHSIFEAFGCAMTLNNTGVIINSTDFVSEAFCNQKKSEHPLLEIGAGFGSNAIAALKNGHTVICNDLSKKHLDIAKKNVPHAMRKRITFIDGNFPDEINLAKNSISAILCCRVLHFFNGKTISKTLDAMHRLLIPKGKIFATVETPFIGNWRSFLPEYEARVAAGHPYPGLIENHRKHDSIAFSDNIPDILHLFDLDNFSKLFDDHGFIVEQASYINRQGVFPVECLSEDGRDSVGIIASKPD
jgi:ubiquinone/menaquinone biosynthesis C-methylase UbiE